MIDLGQPPQRQQQPEQPGLPEDFTQADRMRLTQLNQALSEAQNQIDDGELHPDEGNELKQGILKIRLPLIVRQKASQDAARGQAIVGMQQDAAQAQTMAHADAVYRANGLRDRIVPVTHPMTGAVAMMYEQSPNKWAQLDFSSQDAPAAARSDNSPAGQMSERAIGSEQFDVPPGEGQGVPPTALGTPPTTPFDLAPDQTAASKGNGLAALAPKNPVDQPVQMNAAPGGGRTQDQATSNVSTEPGGSNQTTQVTNRYQNADGTHTLEIWNGANKTLATFDRSGKIVSKQDFDPQGNPVQEAPSPEGQALAGFAPAQRNFIMQQAMSLMPPMPTLPQGPVSASMMERHQIAVRQWHHDLALTAGRLAQGHQRQLQAQETQASITSRSQQQANDRIAATAEKLKVQRTQKYEKDRDNFHKMLQSEAQAVGKEEKWMDKSHEEKVKEAEDRLQRIGVTRPVDPNAPPPEPDRQAEAIHTQMGQVAATATKAGDLQGAAAAQQLHAIMIQYRKLDQAPPAVQAKARQLLSQLHPYMGQKVKPVGPAPPKTIGEIGPKGSPLANEMPGRYGGGI